MQLLRTEAEIRAAIAIMHPVARTAAQNLAAYLLENPAILKDEKAGNEAFLGSCAFAMSQAGWDLKDEKRVTEFLESQNEAITNVCISIVVFVVNEGQRRRKWGWLGKAGAFAAGALLTALFG